MLCNDVQYVCDAMKMVLMACFVAFMHCFVVVAQFRGDQLIDGLAEQQGLLSISIREGS